MTEATPFAGAVIYSENVDRLVAFYCDALGFVRRSRESDHAVVATRDFQLVIVKGAVEDVQPATPPPNSVAA